MNRNFVKTSNKKGMYRSSFLAHGRKRPGGRKFSLRAYYRRFGGRRRAGQPSEESSGVPVPVSLPMDGVELTGPATAAATGTGTADDASGGGVQQQQQAPRRVSREELRGALRSLFGFEDFRFGTLCCITLLRWCFVSSCRAQDKSRC